MIPAPVVRERPPTDTPIVWLEESGRWTPSDNPPPPGLGWLALIVPVGVLVGWLLPFAWWLICVYCSLEPEPTP